MKLKYVKPIIEFMDIEFDACLLSGSNSVNAYDGLDGDYDIDDDGEVYAYEAL